MKLMSKFLAMSLGVSLLFSSLSVFAIDRSEEINELIAIYQGDNLISQKKATEPLAWAGITDERVYDEIERLLLSLYAVHGDDRLKSDSVSWFIKGLGFSGNPKYLPTLEKIESEGVTHRHQKYIDESKRLLPQYAEWNAIINDESQWNHDESSQVNRYLNMIRSDSMRLKELAAKRIYNERISSVYALDAVEQELLAHYGDHDKTSDFASAYGFMSKSLGAYGNGKYLDTIKLVGNAAFNKKLKQHARRHHKQYR